MKNNQVCVISTERDPAYSTSNIVRIGQDAVYTDQNGQEVRVPWDSIQGIILQGYEGEQQPQDQGQGQQTQEGGQGASDNSDRRVTDESSSLVGSNVKNTGAAGTVVRQGQTASGNQAAQKGVGGGVNPQTQSPAKR